jgi:hypothetical protein
MELVQRVLDLDLPPLYLAGVFIAGVVVGYIIRAFISARHRAKDRRRRHDFE